MRDEDMPGLPPHARLGVLEFGWQPETDHRTNLLEVVETARVLEETGYERFWLAEHQTPLDSWLSAAPLAATLLARTDRLTIGAGGVQIGVHRPLEVVSDYALLAQLHPARVELGLSQGGTPQRHFEALRIVPAENGRPQAAALADVVRAVGALLLPPDGAGPAAIPAPPSDLRPYLLGNSTRTALLAAELGFGLAQSSFHARSPRDPGAAGAYRAAFAARYAGVPAPRVILALGIVGDETIPFGRAPAVPDPAQAFSPNFWGPAEPLAEAVLDAYAAAGADDLMLLDMSPAFEARRRTYRRLARLLR
jgi:alkanesulfonate monooxygenase SsuD/methylene tetrahydromethanopterin reductase-like flavin-dependent oxidoreductase (luciferase family)